MLTEINGTIKLFEEEGGQKLQLIIPGSDYEKFKEYGHPVDPKKFYVDFSLDDEQLWVTGFFTGAKKIKKIIL